MADGKPTLTAVFPTRGGGEPHRLDWTYLLEFPLLVELFAEGMLQWGKSVDPKSRATVCAQMRSFWFAYLAEHRLHDIPPSRLDEQVMAGFNAWLHQKRQKNGQPLHPNTIRQALGSLRSVLAHAPGARELLDLVPAGPRGASRRTEPTEALRFDQLLEVMAAAEKEILALRDRCEEGRRLLEQGRVLLQAGAALEINPGVEKGRNPRSLGERNRALALAMLDARYPGVIPHLNVIRKGDGRLGATIQRALGHQTATGYLYAGGRDLAPLAVCLACATVFNADTVLSLEWKNIDRTVDRLGYGAVRIDVQEDEVEADEPAGPPLVRITGDKARAKRQLVRLLDPVASDPEQFSLNLVLDLLTALTARIRPHVVSEEYADRVFLFVPRCREKRAKGFGSSSQSEAGDVVWKFSLAAFIADHELPRFTLRTLRATLLDLVQIFKRGDLDAAQQVGNHRSRLTTWTHYNSGSLKRLLQEATGEIQLLRQRWLDSGGKLDPRKHRESTSKGCATPGFICLDPYASPRPNQQQGRLCTAYGECPDCPLAVARPDNPRSVVLYEALQRAIQGSVTRMTAPVWQQRWAPVLAALNELLAAVPPNVLEQSRSLRVELPHVG